MSQKFGTRRQKAKEETRRIILDTAYSLFEEKGYEKATMRELAARAGVGLGTIFQHFSDKPSLLIAAFEEDLGIVIEDGIKSLPPKDLKAQLIHLVRGIFGFYADRPLLARVLIKEIFLLEGGSAEKIDELVSDFWIKLAVLFEDAAARGEVRPDINIPDAIMVFWAYYSLSLILGLKAPVFDLEIQLRQMERLIEQHFEGLRPRTGEIT